MWLVIEEALTTKCFCQCFSCGFRCLQHSEVAMLFVCGVWRLPTKPHNFFLVILANN